MTRRIDAGMQPRRIFRPTLERRLRTSIETILKAAEWNVRGAAAIEQAWLEEQESSGECPAAYPSQGRRLRDDLVRAFSEVERERANR